MSFTQNDANINITKTFNSFKPKELKNYEAGAPPEYSF